MRKIALLAAMACAWAGCVNYDKPILRPAPQTPDQANFEAVWRASLAVLREYRFDVAVQDRREGTITTAPLAGMYYVEFWRKDAVAPADVLESSLQNLYKAATVAIRPAAQRPGEYAAAVTVEVWRSEKPALMVTSTSEAYGLFTMTGNRNRWLRDFGRGEEPSAAEEERSAAARLRPLKEPATQKAPASAAPWRVPLGRDGRLERQMASEIAAAAERLRRAAPGPASQPGAASQPTPTTLFSEVPP